MKLTPWFPAHIKPVYPGVYEVRFPPGTWYRRWDGTRWYSGDSDKKIAALSTLKGASPLPWRGLAKPPKGWGKA
jgi:hypothetical protein